jgi:hypothetical protein
VLIAGEKWSYELPLEKRAPQAVQKDDVRPRATKVAYGEPHSAGSTTRSVVSLGKVVATVPPPGGSVTRYPSR